MTRVRNSGDGAPRGTLSLVWSDSGGILNPQMQAMAVKCCKHEGFEQLLADSIKNEPCTRFIHRAGM
jgi:hypothetical protein